MAEPRRIEQSKDESINIHMHGTQIQVFAQRSRLLVEELKSLMSEWHKDEIRSEGNTAKKVRLRCRISTNFVFFEIHKTDSKYLLLGQLLVARYRQELSNLVDDYLGGVKVSDIVPSNVDETASVSYASAHLFTLHEAFLCRAFQQEMARE